MSHIIRTYKDGRVETHPIQDETIDDNNPLYDIKYDDEGRIIYQLENTMETFYSYDSEGNNTYKKINIYEYSNLKGIHNSYEYFYKYNKQGKVVYEKNVSAGDTLNVFTSEGTFNAFTSDGTFNVFTYDYLNDGVTLHTIHENGVLRERYTYDPETSKLILAEDISEYSYETTEYVGDNKVINIIKHHDGTINTSITDNGVDSNRTESPDGKVSIYDVVFKEVNTGMFITTGHICSEIDSDGTFETEHYDIDGKLTKLVTNEYTDEYHYG